MIDLTANHLAFQNLKKPKAIIFDWDNTLVNTWPLIQSSINKTMRFMGKGEWSLEKVRNNVHKSMRESFPAMFGNDWQKAGEVYQNSYREISSSIQLLEGARELIEILNKLEITQFVVSNKIGSSLRKEVENLGLTSKFFAVVGAHDAELDKPSDKPVKLALENSDLVLKKDEIWFIGDTIADIECAHNSGCTAVVFAESSELISTSLSEKILQNGFDGKPLPAYFGHESLIKFLSKFFV